MKKPKPKRKYAKRLSLWPLKAEEALRLFMQVDPEAVRGKRKNK